MLTVLVIHPNPFQFAQEALQCSDIFEGSLYGF